MRKPIKNNNTKKYDMYSILNC